jgi:flagellar hook-associated protein 1 FlgK
MGVNFSSFEIGKRALRASQLGLTVAGQNIANVNTPGYTRQAVQLSATPSDGVTTKTVGMGVTVDGVRSFREHFLESRLQTETGISGRLTAKRDALAPVETTLSDADGNGINASISKFFNSFSDLEAHPSSVPLRSAVIGSGNQLASDFHSTHSRLVEIRRLSDSDLRATTDQVNELSARVADLNGRIRFGENSNASVSELRDQRGELIRQISELTGARSVENNDFTVNLTLGDGRALVTGDTWSKLTAQNTPPDGLATLILDGAPAVITDGKLKGLTEAIGDIGARIGDLDSLAASIAARVNTIHAGGSDLDGVNGTNFFAVPPGGVNAANLSVSAALQSNPRLVVAAGLAVGSGDGTAARNIAALLSDTTSVSGARTGTFTSIYGSIVDDAGAGVKTAEDDLATQQAILSQVTAQRGSFSGVSLDEEAISLMQYQKAYEAAARFLKIADEMTQTILSIGQ